MNRVFWLYALVPHQITGEFGNFTGNILNRD